MNTYEILMAGVLVVGGVNRIFGIKLSKRLTSIGLHPAANTKSDVQFDVAFIWFVLTAKFRKVEDHEAINWGYCTLVTTVMLYFLIFALVYLGGTYKGPPILI